MDIYNIYLIPVEYPVRGTTHEKQLRRPDVHTTQQQTATVQRGVEVQPNSL